MIRSKSKDGMNQLNGPSWMSSEQKAKYLHELRSNRPQRPTGARPPPSSFVSTRDIAVRSYTPDSLSSASVSATSPTESDNSPVQAKDLPSRSASAQSHRVPRSNTPNTLNGDRGRPIAQPPQPAARNVSSATMMTMNSTRSTNGSVYRESGKRVMERMEAQNLRKAMEDLEPEKEKKIFSDAQDEAADLVWKHQNPDAPYPNPDGPYRDPGLSRKDHGRSQSLGGEQDLHRVLSKGKHRYSYAGGFSSELSNKNVVTHHHPYASSTTDANFEGRNYEKTRVKPSSEQQSSNEHTRNDSAHDIIQSFKHKRRSSGSKRTPSGSLFRNPEDKIYEEPEQIEVASKKEPVNPPESASIPLQVRRNPFARVKFAVDQMPRSYTDPVSVSKFDKFEIHKNAPSQSRNAGYTSNTGVQTPPKSADSDEVKMKEGKEVRGDDIRAATSMRLKDRSPKLPTPTVVSDKPGRPIVSFQPDWKPKEAELKQEESRLPAKVNVVQETAPKISAYPPLKIASAPVVPTIQTSGKNSRTKDFALPPIQTFEKYDHTALSPTSTPAVGEMPPIPVICAPDDTPKPPLPEIVVPAGSAPVPEIVVPIESTLPPSLQIGINRSSSTPPTSSRDTQSITADRNSVSSNRVDAPTTSSRPPPRPLPTPTASTRSFPRGPNSSSRSHWTPAAVRTGALCTQCALPIAGRIVSAAGHRFHPECFTCHHCAEALECVAFYPEPENVRDERLSRIHSRQRGEDMPVSWPSGEQDGDESMRFYCHLDFHEFFSPRCKNCKTPIEGEVVVACGAEWHVGHFFCAQCGDPFDSHTPFVEKDGYAWCVGCHTNRYSPKCKGCRKPVTGMVVKALRAEWHQGCFVCVECKGGFEDGRYFLRGDSQDPVCMRCEEMRLKA